MANRCSLVTSTLMLPALHMVTSTHPSAARQPQVRQPQAVWRKPAGHKQTMDRSAGRWGPSAGQAVAHRGQAAGGSLCQPPLAWRHRVRSNPVVGLVVTH